MSTRGVDSGQIDGDLAGRGILDALEFVDDDTSRPAVGHGIGGEHLLDGAVDLLELHGCEFKRTVAGRDRNVDLIGATQGGCRMQLGHTLNHINGADVDTGGLDQVEVERLRAEIDHVEGDGDAWLDRPVVGDAIGVTIIDGQGDDLRRRQGQGGVTGEVHSFEVERGLGKVVVATGDDEEVRAIRSWTIRRITKHFARYRRVAVDHINLAIVAQAAAGCDATDGQLATSMRIGIDEQQTDIVAQHHTAEADVLFAGEGQFCRLGLVGREGDGADLNGQTITLGSDAIDVFGVIEAAIRSRPPRDRITRIKSAIRIGIGVDGHIHQLIHRTGVETDVAQIIGFDHPTGDGIGAFLVAVEVGQILVGIDDQRAEEALAVDVGRSAVTVVGVTEQNITDVDLTLKIHGELGHGAERRVVIVVDAGGDVREGLEGVGPIRLHQFGDGLSVDLLDHDGTGQRGPQILLTSLATEQGFVDEERGDAVIVARGVDFSGEVGPEPLDAGDGILCIYC